MVKKSLSTLILIVLLYLTLFPISPTQDNYGKIAFSRNILGDRGTNYEIFIMNADGSIVRQRTHNSEESDLNPA